MKIARIVGVGTDITSVGRMLDIIKRGGSFEQRFLKRVLHPVEMGEYSKIREGGEEEWQRAAQYMASRWAFKEAMVKASGNTRLLYPGMYLKKKEEGSGKPEPTIEGDVNSRIIYEEL